MKTLALAVLSASLCFAATGAEHAVKLTGIAQGKDGTVALLEISLPGGGVDRPILEEGGRVYDIEVTSINLGTATVSLQQGGKVSTYSLGAGTDTGKAPTVNLKESDSRQVIDLYQRVSGRTVVASPALPVARVTVKSEDGPVGVVARALSDSGIAVTQRSDKFAFATAKSNVPTLSQIKDPSLPQDVPKAERFPAGLIKFIDVAPAQVLDIYQELSGRTLIVSPDLPQAKITLRSETALARAESIWLIESALYLGGIAATRSSDKFTFITRVSDAARLAEFEGPPAPAKDPSVEQFTAGLIRFNEADLSQVLDIYQELTGRTVVKSPVLPHVKLTFKSQTELTREEASWLVQAVLHVSGIAAAPRFDKFAFVTVLGEARRVAQIKPPPAPPADPNIERFPPGLIKFARADVQQILDIYQELIGRTVQKAAALPSPKITLRSQTELTRDEAVWLLESALQLGGIRFVPAGDNEVKAIPETSLKAANN